MFSHSLGKVITPEHERHSGKLEDQTFPGGIHSKPRAKPVRQIQSVEYVDRKPAHHLQDMNGTPNHLQQHRSDQDTGDDQYFHVW